MRLLLLLYQRYACHSWPLLGLLLLAQLAATISPLVFGKLITMLGDREAPEAWVWGAIGLVCALDALHIGCQYGFNRVMIRQTASMARCMKNEAVRRFFLLPTEKQENNPAGEWERRISVDTQVVAQSVCSALGEIASTLIAFCLVSLVLIYQQPIFLLLMTVLALSFLSVYQSNRLRLISSARKARTTNYEEGTTLLDLIELTPLIRLFRVGSNLQKRFSRVTQRMEEHSAEAEQSANTYTSQIRAIMVLGSSACLILSVIMYLLGTLEAGAIVAYTMLVGQIAGQMGQLVFVVPTLARGGESAQALEQAFTLSTSQDTNDAESEKTPQVQPSWPVSFLIRLQSISFSYHRGKRILDGLDWDIRRGEYHSVLGSNGEGKSTLIRLILGSLQSQEGTLLRHFTRPGYVPQHTAIFHGSLRDNITLCNDTISTDHLKATLHICRLEKLVTRLGGLDCSIAREQLSGGEIQRIGIARALAIDPDLLVVDEITNNLDIINKAVIFNALRELKGGRTIISISHDLDALADSDYCWLLQRGRLHSIPGDTTESKRANALHLLESQTHANTAQ